MHICRRMLLKRALAYGSSLPLASLLGGLAAGAQGERKSKLPQFLTAPTRKAIADGLSYLASRQNDDGSLGGTGNSRNVAVCGLTGMAFMSAGHMPGRGPYGKQVTRSVDYILANCNDSGFISAPGAATHGPMYGHGFATLFLAEVYGMSPNMGVRDKLASAVKLIVNTQNSEGGWRYQPQRREADLSVTICQVMALRAAKNAGIYVPPETIDRCTDYVKRCQNPDGGFMYMLSQPGTSAFPRSAAGIVSLYSAGIYDGPEIQKGLEYLGQFTPGSETRNRENHFFYGQYYGVQAMWHAGGEHWTSWYPAIQKMLLARQRDDHSWFDIICAEYGTAMACLILQMPNSHLPIFQK